MSDLSTQNYGQVPANNLAGRARELIRDNASAQRDAVMGRARAGMAPQATSTRVPGADLLRAELAKMGLSHLYQRAVRWLIDGLSASEVLIQLRNTPEWKQRFVANELRRKAGLPELDEEVIIAFETQAKAIATAYGLPRGFYDEPQDFAKMLGQGWRIQDFERRVVQGFAQVTQDQDLRQAFGTLFGVQGDAMLASFFLDPKRAAVAVEDAMATAQAKASASRQGFDLSLRASDRLGDLRLSQDQLASGFGQLAEIRPLLTETITETSDITDDEGALAVFGLDSRSAQDLERRRGERAASTRGSTDYTVGRDGGTGLGSAE